tara:strand:- start:16 stop:399 length:384 start_codon:yes stop_codon:yes gene_type:complete
MAWAQFMIVGALICRNLTAIVTELSLMPWEFVMAAVLPIWIKTESVMMLMIVWESTTTVASATDLEPSMSVDVKMEDVPTLRPVILTQMQLAIMVAVYLSVAVWNQRHVITILTLNVMMAVVLNWML